MKPVLVITMQILIASCFVSLAQVEIIPEVPEELQPVTIKKRNVHIREIIDEFRKQVPISIDLDPAGITKEDVVDEFIVENVPFRNAFEAFLKKAGLEIIKETPYLINIAKPIKIIHFKAEDAPVDEVIWYLATQANLNVIISPGVKAERDKRRIRIMLNNISWREAIETIAQTAGVFIIREDNFLRVITDKEIDAHLETRVFTLKYIHPPPSYLGKIEPTQYLERKKAEEVKEFVLLRILEPMLTRSAGKTIGKIDYDAERNTLVITDTTTALNNIQRIINLLDREPLQVVIDVKQVLTTNTELVEFGISYGGPGVKITTTPEFEPGVAAGKKKRTRLPFGLGHESPVSSTFFLTGYQMEAIMRALKEDKFSKVVQQPSLSALDNTEATIFSGETVRYVEVKTEVTQFGGIATGIVEKPPVNVGFQLMIIPRIIKGTNKIILTIIPADSSIRTWEIYQTPNVIMKLPQIVNITLVTRVIIEDGMTVVLGGLVTESQETVDEKIPLLGDLPILGHLFKYTRQESTKKHLLFFVTPRIVRSASSMQKYVEKAIKK